MNFPVAESTFLFGLAYAITGAGVAAAFLLFGIERLAPESRHAYPFRVLLVPGLCLLWPLVLLLWFRGPGADDLAAPPRRLAHATSWASLAVVLPLLLVVAFWQRQASIPAASSLQLSDVGEAR